MKKLSELLKSATIPIVITIMSGLLNYFAGTLELGITKELQIIFSAAAALALFWIFVIGVSVKTKFGTTKSINGPRSFWRLIYNKPSNRREHESQEAVDIAIIYDSKFENSTDVVNHINSNYSSHNINIIEFDYSGKKNEQELSDFLFNRKDPIDAIYFLLTDYLSKDEHFIPIIERWGIKNDDKPIMYADYSNFSNENITYGKVSKEEADAGLWRLIVRAAQRSRMWKEQATTNRKYFFSLLIFFLGFLFINYYLFQNQRKKDIEGKNNLQSFYEKNTEFNFSNYQTYSGDLSNWINNNNTNSLSDILKFYVKEIQSTQNFTFTQNCLLSVWKQRGDSIFRIARNEKNNPSSFPLNSESIIGNAFLHLNNFILWKIKTSLDPSEVLIWNEKGDKMYKWDNENYKKYIITCIPFDTNLPKIELKYDIRKDQISNDEDKRREALFCLAMQLNDFDKYGVCLEFETLPKQEIDIKLLQKQLLTVLSNAVIERVCKNSDRMKP